MSASQNSRFREDLPDDPLPFRDAASLRSYGLRIAFEAQVRSTPTGRRSYEMRTVARSLYAGRREEEAFALFEQAAALHSPDDTSAAAAMCWYDLAETYTRRQDGVLLSNFRSAEELFRRALRCPPLARDLHRSAKVRNGLASCLRHLVLVSPSPSRSDPLLDEAARLFREAIEIAEKCGEVERESLSSYWHNFGNLEVQRGNLDDALAHFGESERHARCVLHPEEPGSLARLLTDILVRSAQARAQRNGTGDIEQALSLLHEALESPHPKTVDLAHLTLAEVLLVMEPPRTEEAIQELRQVQFDRLEPGARIQWVALCEEAGLHGEALSVLHLEIRRLMMERTGALADHTADTYAAHAQTAAHWAARLEVARGEPLEAFFTLETVSGMRFAEATGIHGERAEKPLARALQAETHAVGTAAAMLDHTANSLALAPAMEQRRALRTKRIAKLSHERRATRDDRWTGQRLAELTDEAMDRAIPHADPAGCLRREAQRLKQRAMDLQGRLASIAPEVRRFRPWDDRLTPDLLKGLLQEHPNHALFHVSAAEDLLVVAVWLDGGDLVARSHRAPLPGELVPRLAVYGANREKADPAAIEEALASVDFSEALPPKQMEHGVLLPSFIASFLPLSALGPRGGTLLDRFLALSWMPCLSPLFDRQSAHRPRQGTVSVAPGDTAYHDVALSVGVSGETRMLGESATVAGVLDAALTADVMCFYTHGEHTGDLSASLDLRDGKLDRRHLLSRWIGMERVELWACASGVNLPHDPLTPPVDEVFGFDSELLKVGVRSTIGTLWPVSDLETALLVARYRIELNRCKSAPRALADAQRAVRDDPTEVLRSIETAETGEEKASGDLSSGEPRLARRRTLFQTPLSWAGFRFIGVSERRPLRPWGPEDERDLTPEEALELQRILAEPAAERIALDDWQEAQLAEATTLSAGDAPAADQAIRVARLYRDRVSSCRRHNIFAGLAWLHEALAHVERGKKTKAQTETRIRLRIEAAWLWVDVASRELLSPAGWILDRPDPVAAARARSLIDDVPDSPPVRALRAWVTFVGSDLSKKSGYESAVRETWRQLAPVLEGKVPEGYEGTRTLTAVLEMALLAHDIVPEAASRCLGYIRKSGRRSAAKMGLVVATARLHSVENLLARKVGEVTTRLTGPEGQSHLEAAREGLEAWIDLWRAPTAEAAAHREIANRYLNHLESMLWGFPDDDRGPMWRSTGTLGSSYRRLLGTWMWQMSRAVAGPSMAVQMIASLQAATEMRIPAIARWARLMGSMGEGAGGTFGRLVTFLRDREATLERLEEAALLPDAEVLMRNLEQPRFEPMRLDPFRCSVSEIRRCTSAEDLVPWFLGESCEQAPEGPTDARTAAFTAVRKVELLTDLIAQMWRTMCANSDERIASNLDANPHPIQSLLDPGVRLADREDLLRQMPGRWVILGLGEDIAGRLIIASVRRDEGAIEGRLYSSEAPTAASIRQSLTLLHSANGLAETDEARAGYKRSWREIEEALSPALEEVLGPDLEGEPPMIAILAPGGLRTLPYLGVRVRGRPLFEQVVGVLHLPGLNVESSAKDGSREACVFGKAPAEGDTSFGEAAVETLRRWFEPTIVRPPREETTNIVEAGQIEEISSQIGYLRLYGAESAVATSPVLSGVNVGGRRRLSDQNTRGTFLPYCQVVELWADTAGAGAAMAALHDDRDRLPGLVRSFFLSGAAHVVDLAWGVPDLVKALLCERFGMLRHTHEGRMAEILAATVREIAQCLSALRAAGEECQSIEEVLARLDDARRARARDLGLDPSRVIPFASRAPAAGIRGSSVQEVIDEVCDPVHLSAVRCWGWLSP